MLAGTVERWTWNRPWECRPRGGGCAIVAQDAAAAAGSNILQGSHNCRRSKEVPCAFSEEEAGIFDRTVGDPMRGWGGRVGARGRYHDFRGQEKNKFFFDAGLQEGVVEKERLIGNEFDGGREEKFDTEWDTILPNIVDLVRGRVASV